MHQVNGADGARHCDKVNLIAPSEQDGNVPDYIILEVQPQIGCSRTAILIMSRSDVLPATTPVLLPHGVEDSRVVHPSGLETKPVDGNAIDSRNYAAQAFIVLISLRRQHQHRMVQGELRPRRRILPETFNGLGNPVLLRALSQQRDGDQNQQEDCGESHDKPRDRRDGAWGRPGK